MSAIAVRLYRLSAPVSIALATMVVALPLVVAVVALAQRRWVPVLDLAMTEFRVDDVGTSDTPLIGLPGRIGELPDQGSHPGPLSFWFLAPGYVLFGGSSWALEASTVLLAVAWIATALWIGHRRLGTPGVAMVAGAGAVLIRGFGLSVLTQPWNPYMPLLAWLVVLLATWAVLDGDDAMLVPLVVAASFCAQTHIPYLLMAGVMGLLAFGVAVWRAVRSGRGVPRSAKVTGGMFLVLWVGTMADQVRRDPGNISRLLDHFGSPTDDTLGIGGGLRLGLRHLDVVGGFLAQVSGTGRFLDEGFDPDGRIWPGLLLLVVWAGAVIVALRLRHRALVCLHMVLGVALATGVASMSRIFGQRWFYLTLWAWVTATLVLVAIAWTVVSWFRHDAPASNSYNPIRLGTFALVVGILATGATVVAAPSTDHPEEELGETIEDLLPSTLAALDPDEAYTVEFRDAYFFGSQAFALLAELRRADVDATMGEFFAVPVTSTRARPSALADEAIVLVTGDFIPVWDDDERFEQVAIVEPRSDAELAEYGRLRGELLADLDSDGLDDLIEEVDRNLFGVNIDQRISTTARAISGRMIGLGQQTAIYLGPPDSAPA